MNALKTCLGSLAAGSLLWTAVASAQTQIPVLMPKLVTVASERSCLGNKDAELCARIHVDLETSGQDWLDLKLLALVAPLADDPRLQAVRTPAQALEVLRGQAGQWLAAQRSELQEALDEDYFTGYENQEQLRFVWQRGALAVFAHSAYSYSGGAHGMGMTEYRLMDLAGQRWLQLDDILVPGQQDALLDVLIQAYRDQHPELAESWLASTRKEQAEQLLTDNILPGENGLQFNYGPYVLGSYADGQIELKVSQQQLRGLVRDGLMPAGLSSAE
ncbi:MAG: DUF3298 domain-containing protein [Gammaproteobacteria bacterium]|nr:DUF3298 domain-containing protein [Gammaproteobacteria bacterium]